MSRFYNPRQDNKHWSLKRLNSLAIAATIAIATSPGRAQVIPDQTLGVEQSIVISNTSNSSRRQQIEGGAIRGINLFHSFRDFNVPEGQSLYFQNPAGIRNIISRVTGGNSSNIGGTLGVADGTANLFLLNPNGIIFGSNARLDVSGSFVATTAMAIQFGAQGFFSVSNPESPALLTVNPSAFWFNSIAREAIINRSTIPLASDRQGLQVLNGQSLLLLGGDVILDGGGVNAVGGRVELGAVAGVGAVELSLNNNDFHLTFPVTLDRADVTLTNGATVNANGEGGGPIQIWGRRVSINGGSQVSAFTKGTQPGGSLTVNASESLELVGLIPFGNISTLSFGDGKAGDITIETQRLSVQDGAQIVSGTLGNGSAGQLSVNASQSIEVVGGANRFSFLGSFTGSAGQGGNLSINTRRLIIQNRAAISTESLIADELLSTSGDGGNLTINASDSVEVFREGFIFAGTQRSGNAGNIAINTGRLLIQSGSRIGAQTLGSGNAGNITITARDAVFFDGVGSDGDPSGIISSVFPEASGQGGKIRVDTEQFSIVNGAELSAASQGQGSAGNLEVNVRQLRLENQGSISAQTASGQGGNITLQVQGLLLIRQGSFISATAGTAQAGGDGGNITINAPNGFIVGVRNENSDITANAFTGSGGRVNITAQGIYGLEFRPNLTLLSDITASSTFGISGVVTLNTPNVDPNRGLVQLPVDLTDASRLIVQTCPTGDAIAKPPNEFIITGRGGLPPTPSEAMNRDAIQVDLVTTDTSTSPTVSQHQSAPPSDRPTAPPSDAPLLEAQAFQIAANGTVSLVATASKTAIAPPLNQLIHCR